MNGEFIVKLIFEDKEESKIYEDSWQISECRYIELRDQFNKYRTYKKV